MSSRHDTGQATSKTDTVEDGEGPQTRRRSETDADHATFDTLSAWLPTGKSDGLTEEDGEEDKGRDVENLEILEFLV